MSATLDRLISESSRLMDCPAWANLRSLAAEDEHQALAELLDRSQRFQEFSRRAGQILLDFSRQPVTRPVLDALLDLAEQRCLADWITLLFAGAHVNSTEGRPALHMALRQIQGKVDADELGGVVGEVREEFERFTGFAEAVRAGAHRGASGKAFTDVVNIGIGGSDLGLVMADAALQPFCSAAIDAHYVSNIDGSQLADVLDVVDPETTLFVVCSKSFTTLETSLNADSARAWLVERLSSNAVTRHFVAVSVNSAAMDEFGIDPGLRFRMWDWVGGRYSVWSAIGLTLAIRLGRDQFADFLGGAADMDAHFRSAPWSDNLPILLAMIGVWNQNFHGTTSHSVLPYDNRLRHLPAFLQQLEMESNGKSVTRDGTAVTGTTGTVVWGQPGSNAQHSFFQLLHQGTARCTLDFIAAMQPSSGYGDQHRHALANMLAQAEAFARGHASADPHRAHPGGRASSILLLDELSPKALGALIALYEHKVFVQAVIWGINPFDQFGVELGKKMAVDITARMASASGESLPGIATAMQSRRQAGR